VDITRSIGIPIGELNEFHSVDIGGVNTSPGPIAGVTARVGKPANVNSHAGATTGQSTATMEIVVNRAPVTWIGLQSR